MSTLAPRLRFKEFESTFFSKVTLGNVTDYFKGFAFKSVDYTYVGVKNNRIIRVSDLISDSIKNNNSMIFYPEIKDDNVDKYRIKYEDIIVTTVGSRPELKESAVGRGIYITSQHNGFLNQNLLVLRSKKSNVSKFIAAQINTNRYIEYIKSIQRGNANQANITVADLLKYTVFVSTTSEQQKIADFLTSVDTKISLLTEKHRLLKDYKKGVMQQIFSQKIRFKDDDGKAFPDWKEKLLGDIATFTKGKSISKADISIDGMTPCIRYGELYTTYAEVIESVVSATNLPIGGLLLSKANDVIVPSSGETQWDIATAACVKLSDVAYSGDLTVIRTSLNGVFLSYYFNSAKKREIASLSQGSSVIHLYSTHLKSLKIEIPCKAEQQKIAQFLQSLDKKINAVNEQIEQTKLFKKGLLQQMFV
ncbi:restriction endonuclease subunit S [Pseudoalteromonas sp. 20-92]|uniref:restriction endonuclease subunit S n=1 Tax=Pseudoalteromonas sp. 20-92 TaxID=2969394 RepID=UPI0027B16205|nr:restriction endonuclease subunit S [Pseudoalteromonas sp. 20-92]MDQ2045921.1 restriction endonuclease subunit S [Pseudoalteromonas sp. 20-92]